MHFQILSVSILHFYQFQFPTFKNGCGIFPAACLCFCHKKSLPENTNKTSLSYIYKILYNRVVPNIQISAWEPKVTRYLIEAKHVYNTKLLQLQHFNESCTSKNKNINA